MADDLAYPHWTRLPPWVKTKVEELGVTHKEQWILRRVPALGGRSIAELAATDVGEALLRDYFAKVAGRF